MLRIVLSVPLRKEQLIAIVLGSIIGVAVAFSLWKFSTPKSSDDQTQSSNSTTNVVQNNTHGATNEFAIVSPNNFAVIREEHATISGLANAGAVIVAYSDDIALTKTSSSGEFTLELPLSSGINKVSLMAFEKTKTPQKQTLTLIHSTALPGEASTLFTSELGTITDVTEDTLQLRSENGEIKQLAISDETSFVKIIDDPEDIEFSDVAIGDYVAALGQVNGNAMDVVRILVTTEPEDAPPAIAVGTIDTLSASEFFVKSHESGELVSIDATKGATTYSAKEDEVTTTRLSTSKEGDEIVIIGEIEEDELVADTIILM